MVSVERVYLQGLRFKKCQGNETGVGATRSCTQPGQHEAIT